MKIKILSLFIVLFCFSCTGQNTFEYKKIQNQRMFVGEANIINIPATLFSNNPSENLQTINKYLKENIKVGLPNLDIVIAKEGIEMNDFNVLVFGEKTKIILEPNDLIRYQVIKIHGVKNVKILNATIIGDRKNHRRQEGEWGHGISILGSENVELINYDVRNCWGDGVYIGMLDKKYISKNILLKMGFLDYNRRNALSITSGENITIEHLIASNTFGTLPMYGLDIEPNNEFDEINNITIKNFKTINNYEGGISVVLHKMKKANSKKVNILISNYEDDLSKIGIRISFILNDFKGLQGNLIFNNILLKDNTELPIKIMRQEINSFSIKMNNVSIENNNNKAIKKLSTYIDKYKHLKNVEISPK